MAFPFNSIGSDTAAPANIDLMTANARSLLQPDNIPADLKTLNQWVLWRYEARPNGTVTKPPYQANGRYAKTGEAATWSTFDDVLAAFNNNTSFAGIGLCLSPDDGLVFIDVDDYGEEPNPLAATALSWFSGTYAETSPSGGNAAHVFCFGELAGKAGTKAGIFEAYTFPSNRYLTVTGCLREGHVQAVTDQPMALELFERPCLGKEPLWDDNEEEEPTDILGVRCPQCGASAEYPDCERCGFDFTAPPKPTDTREEEAPSPFVSVGFDPAFRLEKALLNRRIAALYAGDLCGYADRSTAEQSLALALMTFADGDLSTVAAWLDSSGCAKWNGDGNRDSYRQPTLDAAAALWDGVCFVDPVEHGKRIADAIIANAMKKSAEEADQSAADDERNKRNTAEHQRNNSLFVPVPEFIGTPSAPAWVVRKWLPEASIIQLFGDPSSGKSFLAIDWCCCVATGKDWNGNRVKQSAVLYIAGEGHHGLKRRFAAWQEMHGTLPESLYVSRRAVVLDAQGATAVFQAVKDIPEVPGLIVIDTMATVLFGDENKGQDVNTFINILKHLIAGTGACCLVVHHSGHGDKSRGRGWSGLPGAIDGGFKMVKDEDLCGELTITKDPKDGARPTALTFELEIVDLPDAWIDPDEPDEPVTSCVFRVTGEAEQNGTKPKKLSAAQTIALRAMEKAMTEHGGTFNGQFGVHVEDWRKAAYSGGIAEGEVSAKKVAFQRARKSLLSGGHVLCADDIYWFADVGKQTSAAIQNTAKRKQKESAD